MRRAFAMAVYKGLRPGFPSGLQVVARRILSVRCRLQSDLNAVRNLHIVAVDSKAGLFLFLGVGGGRAGARGPVEAARLYR